MSPASAVRKTTSSDQLGPSSPAGMGNARRSATALATMAASGSSRIDPVAVAAFFAGSTGMAPTVAADTGALTGSRDRSGDPRPVLPHRGGRGRQRREDVPAMLQKHVPIMGQLHAVAMPRHQGRADRLLQLLDRFGDRRRRDAHGGSGRDHLSRLGGGDEIANLAEV